MVRPKPRATRKMRTKGSRTWPLVNQRKAKGYKKEKKKKARLVTLVLKDRDRSQEVNSKPTNVSASLEKGAKTIVDVERRGRVTEWQEDGSFNPAVRPNGEGTQRPFAVKAGVRRLRNPTPAPVTTQETHAKTKIGYGTYSSR